MPDFRPQKPQNALLGRVGNDEDTKSRLNKCEEQIQQLSGKVNNIENEVTGLRSSFDTTLKTSLEANSQSLMSQFKDYGFHAASYQTGGKIT